MNCVICGAQTNVIHHLIFGNGRRNLCDEDYKNGIPVAVPLCNDCHTMGRYRLHDNPVSEALSKMLGQSIYECKKMDSQCITLEEARQDFIKRYGKGYL